MLLGNRPLSATAALALAVLTGGCQPEGKRDVSTPTAQPSAEQKIEPHETALNVASFFDPSSIIEIKRTVKDDMVVVDNARVRDKAGIGVIKISHRDGRRRWTGGESLWDEGKFREESSQSYGDIRDVLEIRRDGVTAGYRAIGTDLKNGWKCIRAFVGYNLLATATTFPAGSLDTLVFVLFCGENPEPSKFDRMLSVLDVVHDREAYRAAVLEAAMPKPYAERRTTHALSVQWDGYADSLTGLAEVDDVGTGGGITFVLPGAEGACRGTFLYGPRRATGTWSAACTNNLAASGTFETLGTGKGYRGAGTDDRGRTVTFAIGAGTQQGGEGTNTKN